MALSKEAKELREKFIRDLNKCNNDFELALVIKAIVKAHLETVTEMMLMDRKDEEDKNSDTTYEVKDGKE